MSNDEDFLNTILKKHKNTVKVKVKQEQKQIIQKVIQEKKKTKLYSALSKPEKKFDPLSKIRAKYAFKTASQHKKKEKQSDRKNSKNKGIINKEDDIPVLKPPPPPSINPPKEVAKKLTPEQKERQKKLLALSANYQEYMEGDKLKELEKICKEMDNEANKKKKEFKELDWETNKQIIRAPPKSLPLDRKKTDNGVVNKKHNIEEKKDSNKQIVQKQINKRVEPMKNNSQKSANVVIQSLQHSANTSRIVAPQTKRQKEVEEEEESHNSFIDDEDYDPCTWKAELHKITQGFRRYNDPIDFDPNEDIPEVGFDTIAKEERVTSYIGQREDQIEKDRLMQEMRRKNHQEVY